MTFSADLARCAVPCFAAFSSILYLRIPKSVPPTATLIMNEPPPTLIIQLVPSPPPPTPLFSGLLIAALGLRLWAPSAFR